MKKIIFMIAMIPCIIGLCSCTDYLDVNPKQVLDDNLLNKPEDVDGFVTAAYARITDIPSWDSPFAPWWSGSMRSDDSYKGGGGTWDGGNLCKPHSQRVATRLSMVCFISNYPAMQYRFTEVGRSYCRCLS